MFSVNERDVVFVLPGTGPSTPADLRRLDGEMAGWLQDKGLLPLAWEVRQTMRVGGPLLPALPPPMPPKLPCH